MARRRAPEVDISAVTSLLQWRSKSKVDRQADESSSIALAQQVLANDATLTAIEATLHVSRTRVLQALLEYAVFLATTNESSSSTSAQSFLFLSKAMLQTTSYQLSLQLCTQLLQAMIRVLAEHAASCLSNAPSFDDALVDSIASVFVRLFEATSTTAFVPRFGTFKPPTDVFATFFHSSLTSLLALASTAPSKTISMFGLAILKTHHALQTNQTNKKKVFLACKQSLATLVTLRASMAALLPYSASMLQELDASIADALFDQEHLHGYGGLVVARTAYPAPPTSTTAEDEPAPAAPLKKKAKGDGQRHGAKAPLQSYQHGLFDEISQLLSDSAISSHVAPFLQMLVREYTVYIRRSTASNTLGIGAEKRGAQKRKAAGAAKPNAITPSFAFWLDACAVTTTFLAQSPASTLNQANGSALWHCLWDVMNMSDIYRVAEDNAAQHQYYYLEQTVASVMDHLNAGASAATDTALLSNMVQCSPKILQPHLSSVFAYLSAIARDVSSAAACLASLVASYDGMRLLEEFLAVLFRGTSKALHQLSNLFAHSKQLDAKMRAAFANMPAGQIESLWLFFHDAMYRSMNAKDAVNDGQIRLVRTVFALYMQEVPVSLHVQPVLLQCAKQTFDLVLLPHALASSSLSSTPSKRDQCAVLQREALCLLGELLALTDKGVDVSFVVAAVFDPNEATVSVFEVAIPSMFAMDEKSSPSVRDYEGGILKLCATRVRQLMSTFRPTDAEPVASFALHQAAARLDLVIAITPFLNELGHAASASACESFVNAITLAAIDHVLVPNLFLDAGFYEIRPFLRVLPTVFTAILTRRTWAAFINSTKTKTKMTATSLAVPTWTALKAQLKESKSAKVIDPVALPPLKATVDFMKAVPIPTEKSTNDLFGCILEMESLLTLAADASHKTTQSSLRAITHVLHEWLQSLLAIVASPLHSTALALLELWTTELLSRPFTFQANFHLWNELFRVFVQYHPNQMAVVNDAVVELATNDFNGAHNTTTTHMDVVALCLESWATSTHVLGDRFFQTLLPVLATRFDQRTSDDAHVLAAALQYCHRSKGGRVHPTLLPVIGPYLAMACRRIVKDQEIPDGTSPSMRLVHVVCSQIRSLNLDLASVGRLVATLLIRFEKDDAPSAVVAPFVQLVESATPDEFHLVWYTLRTELTVLTDPARVLAALRAMLVVLRMERSAKTHRVLADSAKTTLAMLVHICNDASSATSVTDVHVAAVRVVAQAFTKGGDAFDWHVADIHVALLALQPLISATSSQQSPASLGEGLVPQLWQESYLLLLRLLRQYPTTLPQYLPHFVAGCNTLLRALLQLAAASKTPQHPHHTLLHLWASNLTRLYGYMLPHATSFRKHMVYMLFEFFQSHKHDDLPLDVQLTLRPGIYALFDICSKYEKEQLYGTLDSTGKVLLKSIDAQYKETHQYTGKV
ncbi:hypothetical protein H310_06042 [Aphanomyces invadans]|uniref:Nucleolar 27S pre-rRNA processing Urb2/Npa2 C-terminal domain-containing protein n=1 Tax=Aphanomyces invadans TaxID=157072 RepID=A0A024U8L6_9STRA|nr:hypothetical protein H310_06042 [Aphanomyces invadans]ETW02560.1 hypothetical protein H310_06042 [Aphanomyces invadans]|eukprot:XP_008869165.1 hypothetical protein H310_06042 [Aphanomyces invadans]